MKNCPYCAEEIKDEAIKCRWCLSWLVEQPPASAGTPPEGVAETQPASPASTAMTTPLAEAPGGSATAQMGSMDAQTGSTPQGDKVEFTHTGERYLLGYGADYFGIWDRQSPSTPSERFPRTDDGWREAWQRYVAMESNWMDLRSGQRS